MNIEDTNNDNTPKVLSPDEQIEANFAKHLDIAIEAQDGPAPVTTETKIEVNEDVTPKQSEDRSSGDGNNNAQQQPNKEGAPQQNQAHGPKDLKLADGTVIRGGAERRFYEQLQTSRQQLSAIEADREKAQNEAKSYREKFELLESTTKNLHGADPTQVSIGLNIVRDLQRDPAGTMKKLLAEVVAQGYTIEGIGAGIDAAAIQRMIEERLPQPVKDTTVDDDAAIHTEVATFFTQYPDAQPHDALLARVLRDNPGMELRTAYFQMKNAFADKGFDWSLPLEKNLENEQSSLATNQNSKTTVPLPNGGNLGNSDVTVNKETLAHESEDTADIVRAAMREAGLNI